MKSKPELKRQAQRTTTTDHYKVKDEVTLMTVLENMYRGRSRTAIKKMLSAGMVSLNDVMVKLPETLVKPGDRVEAGFRADRPEPINNNFTVVFEDEHLMIIDKMQGINTIATHEGDTSSLYYAVNAKVRHENPAGKVFIVHRLDRDTSGLLVFALSYKVKHALLENWHDKQRVYTAVVEGIVEPGPKTINTWLHETGDLKVISSNRAGKGKEAVTHYESIQQNEKYSLLKVTLQTGRKNQIRVHMQELGHPVAGDKKYGATTDPLKRLCLHAGMIGFVHPITKQPLRFEIPVPEGFFTISQPTKNR